MRKYPTPIRFGIIGTGGVAKAHAQALRSDPRVACVGVTDPAPGRAATFIKDYGFQQEFPNAAAMLASKDIDAVTICTPPRLHAALIVEALDQGKAVISEKPVVLSLQELEACRAAEQRTGGTVGCIFQWRYGRGLKMLQQLIAEGLTGRLLWCNLQVQWFRNADYYAVPWRGKWSNESGGVSVSQSIHGIDALLQIAGLPRRIWANIATLNHQVEVEDYSAAMLEFATGARGTIQCTVDCMQERSQLLFGFEKLTAISNDTPYATSDLPWSFVATDTPTGDVLKFGAANAAEILAGRARQAQVDAIYKEWDARPLRSDHVTQLRDFVTALVEGTRPPIGLEDCRLATQTISGLYKSAMNNGAPVELPIQAGDRHWATWNGVA